MLQINIKYYEEVKYVTYRQKYMYQDYKIGYKKEQWYYKMCENDIINVYYR